MSIERRILAALLGTFALVIPHAAAAATVYSNDFQTSAGPEWSATTLSSTPLPADGSRRFLGRFDNQIVTLTLRGLKPHANATLDLDLYINGTWDGINSAPYGPDGWSVGLVGGPVLLNTTFSNVTSPPFGIPFAQNYPDTYGGATHPQFTGSTEQRTLGDIFSGYDVSAVYHLSFAMPHTADSLLVAFAGAMNWEYGGAHSLDEESWGLDNVVVTTDATVDVSSVSRPSLGLAGVSPNPARGRVLNVSFTLPDASPARLELFDLAGRRVASGDAGGLGAGAHVVEFAAPAPFAPGLYLVRLTQRGATRVARVAVIP